MLKILNSKRKPSAIDEIKHEKINRRLDAIHTGRGVELGELEAGKLVNGVSDGSGFSLRHGVCTCPKNRK